MLQINTREGEAHANLTDIKRSSWNYGGKNSIEVAGFHKDYLGKIAKLRDDGVLVDSGIIEGYAYNKNEDITTLEISPLIYDLRRDFVRAENGDYIRYYDDTLENVLASIIEQYRTSTASPLLYIKSLPKTGIKVKYSFEHKDWLSAYNVLLYKFLPIEKNIKIGPDGGIELILQGESHQLIYGEDVYKISYEENADEIINFIIFDNKIPGEGNIRKVYEDTASIAKYGKRVKYWDDARIKHIDTIDALVSAFFSKNARPKLEVESILTTRAMEIYDKITLSNWEKGFDDDLYITGITYKKGGIKELKVGTSPTRAILAIEEDDHDSIANELRNEMSNIDINLPEYIKETHIESTEIRSPVIGGNQGYFSQKVRVGREGIIIDGEKKQINSSNYNPEHNTGFMLNDSGQFLFGGNDQNFIKWNGNLLELRGLVRSTQYENYGSTPAHQEGLLRAESSALPGSGKVLWGYFGGKREKQQISMSRMQEARGIDLSGDTEEEFIETWFQPRFIIFNGFFESVGNRVWGTVNGQAGIESYQHGLCNYMRLNGSTISMVTEIKTSGVTPASDVIYSNPGMLPQDIHSDGRVARWLSKVPYVATGDEVWQASALAGWSHGNTTVYAPQCGFDNNVFATSSYEEKEVRAKVLERKDNGIRVRFNASDGWRIAGNIFILG